MKFDLAKVITDLKGKPINVDKDTTLTVREALFMCCVNSKKEEALTGEEKFKKFKLAELVQSENPDFKVEEVSQLKLYVGDFFTTQVVGFLWGFLEKPMAEEKKDVPVQPEKK